MLTVKSTSYVGAHKYKKIGMVPNRNGSTYHPLCPILTISYSDKGPTILSKKIKT